MLRKLLILTTAVVLVAGQSIDECLKQDSISCVQKTLYRTAKELFAKDKLELVSGISLVKSDADVRSSRSGKELVYDQEMDAANDIVGRQNTLENFISDEAGQFLTGRSIRVKHHCRTIIPDDPISSDPISSLHPCICHRSRLLCKRSNCI